jgi:cobalamin biosynthesis Mg chelatase CobN
VILSDGLSQLKTKYSRSDRILEIESNLEAFRNIVAREIEAHGRGFWNADEEKLEKLRELYQSTEDELEGVTV